MAEKPLELTVSVTLKRGYDTVASHTLTAPVDADARLVGMHVERTVENLRTDATAFATTTTEVDATETD